MKCNDARRMVVPYVKKELSERDTEAFLLHIESCADCMDELEMYFIVTHALSAMDSGEHHEYDFQKMLSEEIRTSKRLILRRKIMNIARLILLILAELLLILCIFLGVRMKQGAEMDGIFERAILRMRIEQRTSTLEELESAAETEAESLFTDETPKDDSGDENTVTDTNTTKGSYTDGSAATVTNAANGSADGSTATDGDAVNGSADDDTAAEANKENASADESSVSDVD